jgi:hypothetical protein
MLLVHVEEKKYQEWKMDLKMVEMLEMYSEHNWETQTSMKRLLKMRTLCIAVSRKEIFAMFQPITDKLVGGKLRSAKLNIKR